MSSQNRPTMLGPSGGSQRVAAPRQSSGIQVGRLFNLAEFLVPIQAVDPATRRAGQIVIESVTA